MKLKTILLPILFSFVLTLFTHNVEAQRRKRSGKVKSTYVKSYTKKNGTRVSGHYRSSRY